MNPHETADKLWLSLWRQIVPFEARLLLFDGMSLSMVRALYPLAAPEDGVEGEHFAVQVGLLHLLGARLYGTGTPVPQPFWELLMDACDKSELPVHMDIARASKADSLSRGQTRYLKEHEVLATIASFDETAWRGVQSMWIELSRMLQGIAWWLLCDDMTLRHGESGAWLGRYAVMFAGLLNAGEAR